MSTRDELREAVEAYVAWEYRRRGARRFTLSDLRAALAATPPEPLDAKLYFEPCRDFTAPRSCYTNDGTGLWCDPCTYRRARLSAPEGAPYTGRER